MSEAKTSRMKATKRASALWAPPSPQFWHSLRDEVDRTLDRVARTISNVPVLWRSPEVEPIRHIESAIGVAMPAIDVVEKSKEYQLTAELPGVDESAVDLSVSGDVLTIKGEKRESDEERGSYYLTERRYGPFQRSFYIPDGVNRDEISARFDKGVLTVALPKSAETVKRQRKILVGK